MYVMLVLSLLVLAVIGVIIHRSINSMTYRSQWLAHTQEVRYKTEQIISIMKEGESGQRGFLVTRDSSYLAYYFASVDSLMPCLHRLRELVKDDSLQVSRIDTLRYLANKRYYVLNRVLVSSLSSHGPEMIALQMNLGKQLMKDLRGVTERIKIAEQQLYNNRMGEFEVVSSNTLRWLELLFLGVGGLFAILFYYITHELRQRWHYQRELEKTVTQLSASNSELDNFIFISSNHLQEPLRKLQTFSDRLSSKYLHELKGDAHFLVQRIGETANQMQTLIHDLLSYTQLGKVQDKNDFRAVSLPEVLKDLCENDFAEQIASGNALVRVTGSAPPIHGHFSQLRMLFGHLLQNSLKFVHPNQSTVVDISFDIAHNRNKAISPGSELNRQWVRVVFSDNGIGFDPQFKDKIFQLFQRLHYGQAYPGTGVGLAICRKIVSNHQGLIIVDSQQNHGTHFTIYFPHENAGD